MASKKTTRKKSARKKTTSTAAESGTAGRTRKAGNKKASKSRSTKSSANSPRQGGPIEMDLGSPITVQREIGGRILSLETGRFAKQADGAVVARYGDTMVLATAQSGPEREDIDFFPLVVDYREKMAAAGKFPGGFFKREGRPTTRETLTCRIIDRAIRPLFPDGFKREVQVMSQVLSTDKENDSDIVAAVASFAALAISSIPNGKTLGACRIGWMNDKLVVNPTWKEANDPRNRLALTVAAHDEAIAMVEAGGDQVPEEVILSALELGHDINREIVEMIDELVEKAGKPKVEWTPPPSFDDLRADIEAEFGDELREAPVVDGGKHARGAAKDEIKKKVKEAFPAPEDADPKARKAHEKAVSEIISDLFKEGEREAILAGRRADGRSSVDIRPLAIEVGVLPRVHGSALFTRGETQALCIATLGTTEDAQTIDGIYPEDPRRFLLHYAFPPFSVGEVRRLGGVGRREIGHGALAERALEPVVPPREAFPYSLRVTSEVLESNGSSSMATVCGATLSMMDAGVPIKQPVAGIAMGLVMRSGDYAILSDILGSEDHCGDMDFKVAGTGKGITALQMDIKCEGLTREILEEALEQARVGRVYLLKAMLGVIRKPRDVISEFAPRLETIQVSPDKLGSIIGPAGRNVRKMQEEFDTRVSIEDSGLVTVSGLDSKSVLACVDRIRQMTADVELGAVYNGRVSSVKEFGAFIEILPGQEGLCHVSELSGDFVRSVNDVVQVGDEIEVKVIGIDDFGKVKLSRKALLADRGELPADSGGGRDRGDRGPREDREPRGRRDRDDREPRGRRDDDEHEPRGRRDRGDRGRPDREERDARGRPDREERAARGRPDREERDARGRPDREERAARGRPDREEREPRGRRDREDREPRGRRDREDREPRDRDEFRGERERDDRGPRARPDRDDRGAPRGERFGRDRDEGARAEPRSGRGRGPAGRDADEDRGPRRGRGPRRSPAGEPVGFDEVGFDDEPALGSEPVRDELDLDFEDGEIEVGFGEAPAGNDDDDDRAGRRRRRGGRRRRRPE
jgi:polyribonucleotide nucleotidyltransferase